MKPRQWEMAVGSCAVAILILLMATVPSARARNMAEDCGGACAEGGMACMEGCECSDTALCITPCGDGNPACSVYVTQGDCEPGAGNNNCNGNHNCNCRWRPVGGIYKCVCQNTTGN